MAAYTVGLRHKTRSKGLTIEAEDAQGRSGQSTLSDGPALQAPARSTRERGVRGSSSSSHWWLLLVGLIAAVLCVPFIRTVCGWAMRVYC